MKVIQKILYLVVIVCATILVVLHVQNGDALLTILWGLVATLQTVCLVQSIKIEKENHK